MSLVRIADSDVLKMNVHFPERGGWAIEAIVDTATMPSGKVDIVADGGFSLKGTVDSTQGGVFLDAAHVQIRGGAGGMGTTVPASAYENAQLRDPLNAAMNATGETLSTTIDQSILNVQLSKWTTVAESAVRVLDELCYAAATALGQEIGWRILGDGTVWLGMESWPDARLPVGAYIVEQFPSENRFVIGATTPSLLPGVNLDGVGKVVAVDHWIAASSIRTWAWV